MLLRTPADGMVLEEHYVQIVAVIGVQAHRFLHKGRTTVPFTHPTMKMPMSPMKAALLELIASARSARVKKDHLPRAGSGRQRARGGRDGSSDLDQQHAAPPAERGPKGQAVD